MFWQKQNTDVVTANSQFNMILSAIQSQNTDALIALISPNALTNEQEINKTINFLFSYCQGDLTPYEDWGGPTVEYVHENGQQRKELFATYDVESGENKYRFAFLYIAEDSANSRNVGVWSMYVINWDDDTDTHFAYRGDGTYQSGIHIGIKNVLPYDES